MRSSGGRDGYILLQAIESTLYEGKQQVLTVKIHNESLGRFASIQAIFL